MGPLVPDLISDQLNLVVALILGFGFGFVLEQAGFSSSRKLAGVFYGYDFTVLRVFFTAAITAMSGVLLLGYFGMLDLEAIYVNPTWLWPATVGGIIMGLGFVLGGYCPGTSICAAAIGKVDAMMFVVGGMLGVFVFGELFPLFKDFYNSSALGPIKVFDSLGISSGLFALILIVAAVSAFVLTTWIEGRVNPNAPSWNFKAAWHRYAALGVLVIGLVLLVLPERKAHLISVVSSPAYVAAHPVKRMSVDELAFRLIDRQPNLLIVDVRSAEQYQQLSLPESRNLSLEDFFSKANEHLLSQRRVKKVVVADNDTLAQTACLLLQKLGYGNVVVLEGGFAEFQHAILDSSVFVPTGSRWENDVKTFRETARTEIAKMIEMTKSSAPKVAKPVRKIKGGC